MRAERCDSPQGFLAATVGYRGAEPLLTNVMATVATGVVAEPRQYQECFWWLVRDQHDEVVGAAIRTAPMMLGLGPMPDDAARALAAHLVHVDTGLPGVIGRTPTVTAFLDHFTASLRRGPQFNATRRDVLYALDRLAMPTVPGDAELATEADFDLADAWFGDFSEEIDRHRHAPNEARRAVLLQTVREGRLLWWRDEGAIVSMAAHNIAITTPGTCTTRVGPVFTPTAHRRHGYGAAVTASVSARLFETGSSVMLFADESNPTSNSIYQAIGYRPVDVLQVVTRAESRT